jgi:hypothetical protein
VRESAGELLGPGAVTVSSWLSCVVRQRGGFIACAYFIAARFVFYGT